MKSSAIIRRAVAEGYYSAWLGVGAHNLDNNLERNLERNYMCIAIGNLPRNHWFGIFHRETRPTAADIRRTRDYIISSLGGRGTLAGHLMDKYPDLLFPSTHRQSTEARKLALEFWEDLASILESEGD